MSKLIDPKELVRSNPTLQYFGGEFFVRFLMRILRFNQLNNLYEKIHLLQGFEFIEVLIESLQLNIKYYPEELKRIPAEGPVIITSNHPLGGLDALLLIHIIKEIRKDIKIVSTELFKKIPNVEHFFIEYQFCDDNHTPNPKTLSFASEAKQHLDQGGLICIFPTGNTSSFEASSRFIYDKAWNAQIVQFIKETGAPIVPFLFQAKKKRMIKIPRQLPDPVKQASLPLELFHLKNKTITARIGRSVQKPEQDKFDDTEKFSRFLRAKTYGLEHHEKLKFLVLKNFLPKSKPETIIDAVESTLIINEVQTLRKNQLLFSVKEYQVYCTTSDRIPNILREIGRLREITFREVGEGSNKSVDLDEYDKYYQQLFIWDNNTKCIVGAYRLGLGQEVMHRFGRSGFFLNSLFELDDALDPVLKQSVELGRSFVVKEYQKKPMPLFLLWKGILYFLLKNHDYRYLIGPASISNNYSSVSKELIIKTITKHFYNQTFADHVTPKKPFRCKTSEENINILAENNGQDLNKLDNMVSELDALNSGIPVLLKKYLKLNAKIAGFTVDPDFNNCLDGLIVLDIFDVPVNIIESLGKEVNDGTLLDRFYSGRE